MRTRKRVSAQRESISVRTRWGWGPSASERKLTDGCELPGRSRESPAPYKIHDLDLIAVEDVRAVVERPLHDFKISLDRDASGVDVELRQQGRDGHRTFELEPIAIQSNSHQVIDYQITRFLDLSEACRLR
jgi:hypothetical protein